MKKTFALAAVLAAFSALAAPPAHAGKGDFIVDLLGVGMNALSGTIPLPYTLAFLALVVAIAVLGVRNARKNALQNSETPAQNSGSINLNK